MAYVRKRVYRKRRMPMRMRRKVPYKAGIKKKVQLTKSANLTAGVHYFKRHVRAVDTTTLSTALTEVSNAFTFRLTDVDNFAEYVSLFDSFRIVGVKLTFRLLSVPEANNYVNSTLFTNGANFYPKLWWVKDMDDNIPLTLSQIREKGYAKCAILYPNKFISVYIRNPRILLENLGGTSTTAVSAPKSIWIRTGATPNTSELNTPFLGLKVVVDKMGLAGNTPVIGIDKQYFFAFKDPK